MDNFWFFLISSIIILVAGFLFFKDTKKTLIKKKEVNDLPVTYPEDNKYVFYELKRLHSRFSSRFLFGSYLVFGLLPTIIFVNIIKSNTQILSDIAQSSIFIFNILVIIISYHFMESRWEREN
jgi:hypothetical protein